MPFCTLILRHVLPPNGNGTGGMAPPLKGGPLPFARSTACRQKKNKFVCLKIFSSFENLFQFLSIFNFF